MGKTAFFALKLIIGSNPVVGNVIFIAFTNK